MGRIIIFVLAGLVAVTVPGMSAAGEDRDARLGRDDDEVDLVLAVDDDDDDTDTGNTGNTGSKGSLDTADRSRSKDRSGDKTGEPNRPDRSRSLDRSRDNTTGSSRGTRTND
ncbi:MAG: hypothetical protein ACRDHH_01215 [Actinomycetota bacterium]